MNQAMNSRALQVAVVGSGPSGFYLADALVKQSKKFFDKVHIDMLEKLPVPFGLVRYGVAPDHPEVKNVEKRFTELANSDQITWLGNLTLGKDLTLKHLTDNYDAVALAVGSPEPQLLNIPGEHLGYAHSAKSFVDWYNTSPDCFHYKDPPWKLEEIFNVVIIGNGNVSMDVARILLTKAEEFAATDMSAWALQKLWKSAVKKVTVVGRRGPYQSAFTIKEFREMLKIPNVVTKVQPFPLVDIADSPRKRLLGLVHETALKSSSTEMTAGSKTFALEYGLRPVEIVHGGVVFEETQETSPGVWEGTKRHREFPAQLVIVSAGQRGKAIPGVPFDEKQGLIPNDRGAVLGGPRHLYCSGWAKTGAKGVIATSLADANETAATMLTRLAAESDLGESKPGKFGLAEIIAARKLEFVTFRNGWERRINQTEKWKGQDLGKEREKIPDIATMLAVATVGSIGYQSSCKFRGMSGVRAPGLEYLEDFLDEKTVMLPGFARTDGIYGNQRKLPSTESQP